MISVKKWRVGIFSSAFFSPFSTLLGARVLKIVLSVLSCYPFWSPDVGSQPAQLVEPKSLTDRERLYGLHFILNCYFTLYSLTVTDVIAIGVSKKNAQSC